MNQVVVSIGSNIEPHLYIPKALEALERTHQLLFKSPLVRTPPIGPVSQPDFINGAALIATSLDRKAFDTFLKSVEDNLGRDRSANKWGPRKIDLDIVVWNGMVVDEDYYHRDFLRKAVDQLLEMSNKIKGNDDATVNTYP